jgi:hypothetical protein
MPRLVINPSSYSESGPESQAEQSVGVGRDRPTAIPPAREPEITDRVDAG